jgi:MOSC domain-containing protein YiiM
MIQIDLPSGPGSPLVRGLAACLASVTEVRLTELPDFTELPVTHALASWKSWLAGRNFGMVPIADGRSFQWAGWWIGVVDHSGSPLADGPQRQVAVLAFGTPPGVVLSPQDPAMLGRATADLEISSAYAVASLNPILPPTQEGPSLRGVVELIAVAPLVEAPMQLVDRARALAGRGLEGDRYADDSGTFSPRGAHRPGYELTLIAAEVVEKLTAREATLDFASTRRNILTRGIDVNALVGRDFSLGDVRCRGLRLAEPCAHLERLHGPGLLRPLIHRGGLRADILTDGYITQGNPISTEPPRRESQGRRSPQ